MADLAGLIERCEKAAGPDRELDLAIWNAVCDHPSAWSESFPPQTVVIENRNGEGAVGNPVYTLDSLSASIDAALALVERKLPRTMWRVQSDPDTGDGYAATLVPELLPTASATGASPALAIILCLLRALAAQESGL